MAETETAGTESDEGEIAGAEIRDSEMRWMGTAQAARRMGITTRTLYKFVDEGLLPAYKFGRVIRLKQSDVDAFIEGSRVQPGTLEHLYPEVRTVTSVNDGMAT